MSAGAAIDHRELYRLPWTLPDKAISWLEPTSACDLACDGCYRENIPSSHKPLAQVRAEIETFRRLRNSDGISIAGGDPLMHPEIVEIVRHVRELGMKPILNTNGGRLSRELLRELKKAGVYGFTFHVDGKQGRPGWKGKNEIVPLTADTGYFWFFSSANIELWPRNCRRPLPGSPRPVCRAMRRCAWTSPAFSSWVDWSDNQGRSGHGSAVP
jgi:hypothetical protein